MYTSSIMFLIYMRALELQNSVKISAQYLLPFEIFTTFIESMLNLSQ